MVKRIIVVDSDVSGDEIKFVQRQSLPHTVTDLDEGEYFVTNTKTNNSGVLVTASTAPAYEVPVATTPPSWVLGNTTVGTVLEIDVGAATGVPTPDREISYTRNGNVLTGQIYTTLDTAGFVGGDVIVPHVKWFNVAGEDSASGAPLTLTSQPAITATIDLQPAGQQSSITFNVAIDGSPTIAQGSTSITATRVGTTNQWTFTAPVEGPISFAATKAGYTAFSDATRTVAPAPSALIERDYEIMLQGDPGSEPVIFDEPQEYAAPYVTPNSSLVNGMAVLAAAVISRTGDVITTTRDPLFTWDDSIEPISYGHAYYRGTTALNATLIEGTEGAISYTVNPDLDGGKNVYRRDWLEGAGSDSELAEFSNGVAVVASNWWTPNSIIDLDFQNSRFRINGATYASIAAAKTANAIKTNGGGVDYIDVAGLGTSYALGAKGATPPSAGSGTYVMAMLEDGDDGDTIDEAARVGWHFSQLEWRAYGNIRSASTNRLNSVTGLIVPPSSALRTAVRLKAADYYQAANGQQSATSTGTGALPAVSRLFWGKNSAGLLSFTGTLQRVVLVNADLTNEQINALLT